MSAVAQESASSAAHFFERSIDRVRPSVLDKAGLDAARVRELLAPCAPAKKGRNRKRHTRRAAVYGWLKVAVANLPPEGIVVASKAHAEKLQAVGRRMGIRVNFTQLGAGPARLVRPALSGAELSRLCSEL